MTARQHLRTGATFLVRTALRFAACSALAASAVHSATAAEPDRIAYVAESGGAFELRFWNAATRRSETVDVMVDAPVLLVWNPARRSVASIRADGIYEVGYARAPYASNPRGDAPPKGAEPVDGWVAAGDTLAIVAASTGAGGSVRCTLYEAPRQGAWVKRAEQAAPAADASCSAFADARRGSAPSTSSARLMRAYQCGGGHAACAKLDGAGLPPGVKDTLLKGRQDIDAIVAIDAPEAPNLVLAGVATGDTPHFHRPLHLLPRAGGAPAKLDVPAGPQLQLALQGRWLLVASEYGGEAPAVVDVTTGTVVWRAQGRLATWVPR